VRVLIWAAELARAFWLEVGGEEPFPRGLRRPVRALTLTLEAIPALTAAKACRWLESNGIAHGFTGPDRPLRGCLKTQDGHGIIFLDAVDPEDEQRFTLAHELAHFLRDYRRPRQRAFQHLGAQARELVDGKRPATPGERLGALLGEVPLGLHLHLMDRDEQRRPVDWQSMDAEACADCLAFELLAPAEDVYAHRVASETRKGLENRLVRDYGLPVAQARRYTRQLVGARRSGEPWLAALRASLRLNSVRQSRAP